MEEPEDPRSRAPARQLRLPVVDGALAVYEWGAPDFEPIVLAHGFLDHGRGFDRLAPLLARKRRVIAFDARGHGDSTRVDAYSWDRDVQDLACVIDHAGGRAALVAHSRGGGQAIDCALAFPERVSRVVDIDGFGPPPEGFAAPNGSEREPISETEDLVGYLDRMRTVGAERSWRPYAEFDAIVARRAKQNPRLDPTWLRRFVFHAARRVEGCWVWKADPLVTAGAGPWSPDWIAPSWAHLQVPVLAVTGTEPDAWGPASDALIEQRLGAAGCERATVEGTGHFVHMERPEEVARLVLDWLPA